jgi:hypothetical protein
MLDMVSGGRRMRLFRESRDVIVASASKILAFAVLFYSLAVPDGQILAHGGGTPRLVDEPVGPYRLYVWTKPDPIRVGTAHFTVGVFTRPAGSDQDEPVLDASVGLDLVPKRGGNGWRGEASQEESANKLYYEADVTIPDEGEWQATVTISGPAGSGSAQFSLVAAAPGISWLPIGGAAVALVAFGWWLLAMRQKEIEG